MNVRLSILLLAVQVLGVAAPAVALEGGGPDPAPAAAPALLHYQGRFTDGSGVPLAGPLTVTFSLYPIPEGGTPLWSETHLDVNAVQGQASILLGSIVTFPPDAFAAPGRYLEIRVGATVLEPRLVVASAPFALEADRLDGHEATEFEAAGTAALTVGALAASDGTPPNAGENRVHWDQLTGVPAGFADGDDAGTSDHGGLTGLEDDDHPQYLLRSDAATGDATPPNEGANLVHWENLVGVPEAFADGTDNVFGGAGGDFVSGPDVQDSSLTGADLAAGSIGDIHLASGAVGGRAIADGAIQPEDLGFLVGDVTSVLPGPGLQGGGDSGDLSLSVGAGTGIQVVGSSVSLNPSYVSGSAYDNRFVNRTAPTWTAQPGAVSIAGAAFRQTTPTGKFSVSASEGYLWVDDVNNVGAEDEFVAPVQLPHGAQITAFWVTYWDNTTAQLAVSLRRTRQSGTSQTEVASVTSTGQSATWQSKNDDIITDTSIDNIEFAYWLYADFPSTPQGQELRLRTVRIEYTTTRPQ